MEKAKVLFVCQEIATYLPDNEVSRVSRYLPQGIQEKGREIRSFMPRYGIVNERRFQLHEVIRLSGMNIIIDDTDHPLIIKVASIQSARMQVYFIDNDDFFQRKALFGEEDEAIFPDNDERSIFFIRGVLETVKKLRWEPGIIHCHGWFTLVLPLLIKKVYNDDPMFSNSKIVLSLYNAGFEGSLDPRMHEKLMYDGVTTADVAHLSEPTWLNLHKFAIDHADALIIGSENLHPELEAYARASNKPLLEYQDEDSYIDAYENFYNSIL